MTYSAFLRSKRESNSAIFCNGERRRSHLSLEIGPSVACFRIPAAVQLCQGAMRLKWVILDTLGRVYVHQGICNINISPFTRAQLRET